ncbi:DUF1284 domain-containing protein [Pontivivens ytuae]|uniref:DUF1284 domain-containing protein n=1 Tax=Pontivivens ytuae TaxID=2789856 RepID=A0A7S9LR43_9RHOB|nr:DUF1284 domain-containing protein [Pontivivens ytuae]QPH53747.1 DUF1284 domain-containing protein [Pontivivens ytuae]
MPDGPAAPVRFRPHHFLCALGFEGKGYSGRFVANMAGIVEGLRDAPDTAIEVVAESDDICTPCPKRRETACLNEMRIAALDRRHARALALEPGEVLSWEEAQARMRARVSPGDLAVLCVGCSWLAQGMCEGALARLHGAEASGGDT